jgi:hypothetical protein
MYRKGGPSGRFNLRQMAPHSCQSGKKILAEFLLAAVPPQGGAIWPGIPGRPTNRPHRVTNRKVRPGIGPTTPVKTAHKNSSVLMLACLTPVMVGFERLAGFPSGRSARNWCSCTFKRGQPDKGFLGAFLREPKTFNRVHHHNIGKKVVCREVRARK